MTTPQIVIEQAVQAAAANAPDSSVAEPERLHEHGQRERRKSIVPGVEHAYMHRAEEFLGIPLFNSAKYGSMDLDQNGIETKAGVADDGRIRIRINQKDRRLSNILVPALRHQLELHKTRPEKVAAVEVPSGLGGEHLPVPPMNVVIQIVGSRGDVQPYVALGQVLKNKYGHRVRVATHPTFKDFVTENGLEFFSIGGDPAELMAFMVKNPGLMPGMDSLKSGDIGKRRKSIYEMITGCWRSCIEAGDGTEFDTAFSLTSPTATGTTTPDTKPFVADAIIANPPSFAHVHIAEKLGIPLHMTFTMPWSPTQSFAHPLANIISTNAESAMTNFVSYAIVDMMTWQGLGDVINRFREKSLGLEPLSIMWAPGMISRLKIPYTYCWSPGLIPKPKDWGSNIDISGFYFLDLATNYTPAPDLQAFLDAGPAPVYIGFGSIVVDDPNAMTKMIFEAVKKSGQRALVSKGWGGFGADEIGIPEGVFMLGNCPHDWLFKRVSCVVHHGGAGTTAAGIRAGRPTVVVPFFGDQPFWGSMVARAGAGPHPVPYKELTADKLSDAILQAIKPESLERAAQLCSQISHENGTETGASQFHNQLDLATLRCSLSPTRVAVWRVKRTDIRLSAFAATVLANEGLIEFSDLKLYRFKEYETEDGPWDPISGGASALIGTLGNLSMGVADFPMEMVKSLKLASSEFKERHSSLSASSERASISEPRTSTEQSPQSISRATSVSSATTAGADVANERRPSEPSPISPTTTVDKEKMPSPNVPVAHSPSRHSFSDLHHRNSLRPVSRSHSGASSVHEHHPPDCPGEVIGHLTLDSVVGAGKTVSRIVGVGLKSPLDFTMGIAQGFHNAPKLYGDDTVRKQEKITGFQSGLKAAGRELTYGFYDGITGLATQPIRGAEKEGAAGFFKGFAKGAAGLILKPGAGIWGVPGFTFKGIYAEIQKVFGSSVQNYIIAARTAQGYEDWEKSTPEERAEVITVWKSGQVELRKHGRKWGQDRINSFEQELTQEELPHGFSQTRHMSFDERKRLADEKKRRKKDQKPQKESGGKIKSRCKFCPFHHDDDVHHAFTFPGLYRRNQEDMDFETAIQKTVTATSKGNPHEDRVIARALRASLHALQAAKHSGDDHGAYEKAVEASVEEAKRARAEATETTDPNAEADKEHDEQLAQAIRASLAERQQQSTGTPSASSHLPHHEHHGDHSSGSGFGTENDELYKQALEESKRQHSARMDTAGASQPEDEDLQRAVTESKTDHEAMTRQQTEEDIVLDYVKKQSKLEEEYRQQMQASKLAEDTGQKS